MTILMSGQHGLCIGVSMDDCQIARTAAKENLCMENVSWPGRWMACISHMVLETRFRSVLTGTVAGRRIHEFVFDR